MRPIRLAVLVASTLLAVLVLAPGAVLAQAQAPVSFSAPSASTTFDAGNSPVSVATGDFNADNDPDLAVANRFSSDFSSGDVSVLLGSAAGGFTGPTSYPTGLFSNSVAVGNFNADVDQDLDLAVANAADGTVSVLLGGPGGDFTGPADFPAGSPYVVAVGDFDRDQDPDLVVADHEFPGSLSVLTGRSGGSFSGPTTIATGTGTAAVAVGEFNQDGDPDLAVGDYDTGRVLVLLGSSGATFGRPTTVATGADPISVTVGEFNQDGHPDLAVAEESGQILVLLGGPDGSFTGPTALLSESQLQAGLSSMAVGDFNRDGDPDLVVAHRSGNQVRVLLGGPGGSFGSSPYDFPTGTLPAAVAVADFNADGKPDLATAHPTKNTVAVLLNTTTIPNRAPTAAADAYTTAEDTTLTVAAPGVLGNDSDPDGDSLHPVLGSGPAHGSLALNADGSFSYTPVGNYSGSDSFTYQASDGDLTSGLATVTLTVSAVNDGPTAADDAYSTAEDTALTVAAPGVLANDTDSDGDSLSAVAGSGPSHGTLSRNANGSFTYTPVADYSGSDSFTYRASDGKLESSPATVMITVSPVNDAPTAADDAYSTGEDTALTVATPGVLANDGDRDGDQLGAVLVSGPGHGTLTLNPDGSFTYTPVANFTGSDSFTYRASDDSLSSDSATVTLTVTASNDRPTVTVAAGGTCGRDDHSGTLNLILADVDSPLAGLTLSVASSNPALVPTGNIVFAGSGAARTMAVSAVDGRSGTAILTVTVSDGQATGTVPVTVMVGGSNKDTLTGTSGADVLLAQSNNDTLTGGDGNDLLCGDSGSDTLYGGGGDDSLGGGSGSDRLTGGLGADRFSGGSGTDTATDFSATEGDTSDGTIP